MFIYIEIEDLVANALIEQMKINEKREVLFEDLDKYGAKVVQYLNENTNEKAILLLSNALTNQFLHDYSDYFELYHEGEKEGIRLREDKTVNDLWERFRSYLSFDVLRAFVDQNNVAALGVGN